MSVLVVGPKKIVQPLDSDRLVMIFHNDWRFKNLAISEDETHLTVGGTVVSFYHKQIAQEIIKAIRSSKIIHNTIEVK